MKGLFGTLDWGISRIIGGPPPTAAQTDSFGYRPLDPGEHFGTQNLRPGNSAGQRSGALMPPSASIAASMERLPPEPNRGPARSQSEPDFGRNAKQVLLHFVDYEMTPMLCLWTYMVLWIYFFRSRCAL